MRRLLPSIALAIALVIPRAALANPPAPRSAAAREADAAVRTATFAGQQLLRLLDSARLARDRARTACLDGKLAQVNSFGRMLVERRDRLRAAEARGDQADAAHERAVVRTLESQLRRIEREGRACGQPDEEPGTTVTFEVGPEVPLGDMALLSPSEERRGRIR